jgi:hypothetical protein
VESSSARRPWAWIQHASLYLLDRNLRPSVMDREPGSEPVLVRQDKRLKWIKIARSPGHLIIARIVGAFQWESGQPADHHLSHLILSSQKAARLLNYGTSSSLFSSRLILNRLKADRFTQGHNLNVSSSACKISSPPRPDLYSCDSSRFIRRPT